MFRKRGLLLLVVSVVMGVGAAWVPRNWVAQQSMADKRADVRTVVAAALGMPGPGPPS